MKKAQANMMVLLGVGVIVTVIILGVVFEFIRDSSLTVNNVVNESVVLTSGKGVTANDDWSELLNIQNNTANLQHNIIGQCNRTVSTGTISCNSTVVSSTILLTYNYFPSTYLSAGTSRTLVSIIPVLLAILILLFVFGFVAARRE